MIDATFSLRIDLAEPVAISSAYDLAQLHRSTVLKATIVMTAPNPDGGLVTPVLETEVDLRRYQFVDVIEFLQATQAEKTHVVLAYQGRFEELAL